MEIKELWHKKSERPERSANILLYDYQGDIVVGYYSKQHDEVQTDEAPDGDWFSWDERKTIYTHWCYVDDIKPFEVCLERKK